MDPQELRDRLRRKSVDMVCRECGHIEPGRVIEVDLGGAFVGAVCGHCGHVRLFDQATLLADAG
jgi:RNase P subunit RPR2